MFYSGLSFDIVIFDFVVIILTVYYFIYVLSRKLQLYFEKSYKNEDYYYHIN